MTHPRPTRSTERIDATTVRQGMGRFATGVAVVTTMHEGLPQGMTVNSLTSVSLDPPLLLVSLTVGSRTLDAVSASGQFGVSILSTRQEAISNRFARRGDYHFGDVPMDVGPQGVPLVANALAQIVCTVEREIEAGDHVVVLGRIVRLQHRDGLPLCFFGGAYGAFRTRRQRAEFWYA